MSGFLGQKQAIAKQRLDNAHIGEAVYVLELPDVADFDCLFALNDGGINDDAMAHDDELRGIAVKCAFGEFDGDGGTDGRPVVSGALRANERVNRRFGLFMLALAFPCFPRIAFLAEMRIECGLDASDGGWYCRCHLLFLQREFANAHVERACDNAKCLVLNVENLPLVEV